MIHHLSDVQTKNIGQGTKIWQYVVILPDAVIGSNCNICSHCFIENNVIIGNNVTIKFFVEICDGVTIEDDVFIAPHVSFTNDLYPRSKKPFEIAKTIVKKGVTICAGVTIVPGLTIGEYAFIAGGSVVTKDIPPYTFWAGVPAKHTGYVTKQGEVLGLDLISTETGKKYQYSNFQIIALDD